MKKHKVYTQQQIKTRVILVNTICFILSVIFTLLILCQLSVRSALKNNTIDESIKNIDYSKIIVQNGEEELPLVTYINDYYILDESVTDEDIDNLLCESTANDFIKTKYNELAQYILGGSYKQPSITPSEIAEQLDINKDLIYDKSPIKFLSDDHAELCAALEGPLNSFNASISGSKVVSYFRTFCSLALVITFAAILLVILVVWSVTYSNLKEKAYPAIRNFSFSAAFSSAAFAIALLIASVSGTEKYALKGAMDITAFEKNVYTHCAFIAMAFAIVFLLVAAGAIVFGVKNKKNYVSEKNIADEFAQSENQENNILNNSGNEEGIETVYTSADDIIEPVEEDIQPEVIQQDEGKKAEINDLIQEIAPDSEISQRIQKTASESVETPENTTETIDVKETSDIESKEQVEDVENVEILQQPAKPVVGRHEMPETEIAMPEINSVGAVPSNGRTCAKCGKVNLSRNLFCSECGELLK